MPTRPSQGGSSGSWGTELNAWLDVSLNADGTPKNLLRVYDTTLGVAAASIDVTGIPATYTNLMVVASLRDTGAVTSTGLSMRLNNDLAANYSVQNLILLGSTVTAVEALGATSATIGQYPGASSPAGSFASVIVDIPAYASTANHKSWTWREASRENTTTGTMRSGLGGGTWFAAAAAINRITLNTGSTSFAIGSRLTIYAMGG